MQYHDAHVNITSDINKFLHRLLYRFLRPALALRYALEQSSARLVRAGSKKRSKHRRANILIPPDGAC